jgi:hypothetical protein
MKLDSKQAPSKPLALPKSPQAAPAAAPTARPSASRDSFSSGSNVARQQQLLGNPSALLGPSQALSPASTVLPAQKNAAQTPAVEVPP